MKVYVVDDEPITARLIASVLTGAGHEVRTFTSGEDAWAAYEAEPVPLIVSDWMMPGMSGVELCAKVRSDQSGVYTNVVVVTALSVSEHAGDAFRAGADDMLGKPVSPEALLRRVEVTERGHLAHAEQGLRKCLEVSQAALGPGHESLLESLAGLAEVARRQRSYVRCRAFVRRQLEIAQSTFGSSDSRVLKLRRDLEELSAFEDGL